MTRSSSTSAGFSNGSSASTTASNSTNLQASTDNGHSSHIEAAAASEPPNTGLVKARTMSYQQKVIENGNNEASEATEGPRKTSVGNGAGPRPNIKELTNKQRNWFSSFERSKNNEPIDSARRTSVKNDSTPSLLSGGSSASEARPQSTPTGSPKSSLSDATPTPPSNLDRPRDRRPLSARCSSDSIEDYIRNWKNGSDESSTSPTNQEKNRQNSPLQTKDVNESAKIVNEGKATNDVISSSWFTPQLRMQKTQICTLDTHYKGGGFFGCCEMLSMRDGRKPLCNDGSENGYTPFSSSFVYSIFQFHFWVFCCLCFQIISGRPNSIFYLNIFRTQRAKASTALTQA